MGVVGRVDWRVSPEEVRGSNWAAAKAAVHRNSLTGVMLWRPDCGPQSRARLAGTGCDSGCWSVMSESWGFGTWVVY